MEEKKCYVYEKEIKFIRVNQETGTINVYYTDFTFETICTDADIKVEE